MAGGVAVRSWPHAVAGGVAVRSWPHAVAGVIVIACCWQVRLL